jgi:hypothetical protein
MRHCRPRIPDLRARMIRRGQSLVEFSLILPILLFLVVGIADFGRVFAAVITMEGTTRDAAEAVANAYLANTPGPLNAPPAPTGDYYSALHVEAARIVCAEAQMLPGVTVDGSGSCSGMPLVQACVHDGADSRCGAEVNGVSIPASCASMQTPPTNLQAGGGRRYVEVRTCYRFDSMLGLPWFDFGTIWVERARIFEIPCYYLIGPATCG